MKLTLEDDAESHSVVVYATDMACVEVLKAFILGHFEYRIHVIAPSDNSDRSPLDRSLIPPHKLGPHQLASVSYVARIDPALLLCVSRMFWFIRQGESMEEPGSTEFRACARYVLLGIRYGRPLVCFDERGHVVPSPLTGAFGDAVSEDLDRWLQWRREYTQTIRGEGIVIVPNCHNPVLSRPCGLLIDAGALDISPALILRLRRLEKLVDSHDFEDPLSEEEEAALDAELQASGEALRRELQTPVTVKPWPYKAGSAELEDGEDDESDDDRR